MPFDLREFAEIRARLERAAAGFSVVVEPVCIASAMLCSWSGRGRLILRPVRKEFDEICRILDGDPDELSRKLAMREPFVYRNMVEDTLIRTRLDADTVVSNAYLKKLQDKEYAAQLWKRAVLEARRRLAVAEIRRDVSLESLLLETDSEDTFYYLDPFFCGRRAPDYHCQDFPEIIHFIKNKRGAVVVRDLSGTFEDFVSGTKESVGRSTLLYL